MLGKMEVAFEADFETMAKNAGMELKKDASGNLVRSGSFDYEVVSRHLTCTSFLAVWLVKPAEPPLSALAQPRPALPCIPAPAQLVGLV